MEINQLYFYKIYRRNLCFFSLLLIITASFFIGWLYYHLLKEGSILPVELVSNKNPEDSKSAFYLLSAFCLIFALMISSAVIIPNLIALRRAKKVLNTLSGSQLSSQRQQLEQANHDSETNKSQYTYFAGYILIHYLLCFRVIDLTQTKTVKIHKVRAGHSYNFSVVFSHSSLSFNSLRFADRQSLQYMLALIKHEQPDLKVINEECIYS